MQMPTDEKTTAPARPCGVVASGKTRLGPRGSLLERRIADGTYTADALALAQSFLEYLEHLAGPA
jgi:hypothetical protein